MAKTARQRIPKLRFTSIRGIGWHVAYRDKNSGHSRRHRFGIIDRHREPDARALYHKWLAEYLGGPSPLAPATITAKPPPKHGLKVKILSGSILAISTSLTEAERTRVRNANEPRRRGTIAAPVFRDLSKQIRDFLEFLNGRHGNGAVARMRLCEAPPWHDSLPTRQRADSPIMTMENNR